MLERYKTVVELQRLAFQDWACSIDDIRNTVVHMPTSDDNDDPMKMA